MYQPTHAMTIDHAQAALDEGLRAIAAGQTHFDLSTVSSVDSSAVAVLLNWQRAASKATVAVRFAGLPPNLLSLVAMYGVENFLKIDLVASPPMNDAQLHQVSLS